MTTLVFDGLDLIGENTYDGETFLLEAEGDDFTWGNPSPINTVLTAMLTDGALVYTQGYDNREAYFRVKVTGTTAGELQAGESALMASCGKRTTIEWTPPGNFAKTTVFKVQTATLEHAFDDLDELNFVRTYGMRIVASPYTRSVDLVTLTAEPAAGAPYSETLIDQITSVTAWTASGTKTAHGDGQAVRSTDGPYGPFNEYDVWLQRSGSVTISASTPYILVRGTASFIATYTLTVDGVDYEPANTIGNFRWFLVPAGTYSTIRVTAHHDPVAAPGRPVIADATLTLWSLYQTSDPGLGTRRELAHTFPTIYGSVRAPGDLTISHDSNGLGDVLAYTYPTGLGDYSPPLSLHRTAGGSITADTTAVSGGKEPINGVPTTWTVPAIALPDGGYHIVMRMQHTTAAGTYAVTFTADVGGTTITRTVNVTIDGVATWQFVSLGTEHLPPLRLLDGSAKDITITLSSSVANLRLDTGWLFLADEYDRRTSLVQVEAGAAQQITYRIADVDFPADVVYLDDYAAGANLKAAETPHLAPPSANVYMVTTGTEDATVEFNYYPHWHTHAGL